MPYRISNSLKRDQIRNLYLFVSAAVCRDLTVCFVSGKEETIRFCSDQKV